MVCDALRKGVNVIMDAQNATVERVHALVGLAADCNADVQTVAFLELLDTLLERNRARAEDDRVPEEYLRAQYERYADTIAVPMQWVRVPVEPAGRYMWRPSEHGHATALVDAMGAYRMACKPLSVEPFRMVKAFLPSQHGTTPPTCCVCPHWTIHSCRPTCTALGCAMERPPHGWTGG